MDTKQPASAAPEQGPVYKDAGIQYKPDAFNPSPSPADRDTAITRLMDACEPFAKAAGDDWLNRFDDNKARDIGRLNYDSGLFYADLVELRSALANARKGGV